ncbi:hypothetical protein BB558_007022, partial [Smittium angustum]
RLKLKGNYNIKTLAEHELASGRCIYSKYSASQKRCSAGTLTRVNVPETIDWLFNVFPGTLNSQLEEACHMTTNWTVTGWKLFGMNKERCRPIQMALYVSIKAVLRASRYISMTKLQKEMIITTAHHRACLAQIPTHTQKQAWVSGTTRWMKVVSKGDTKTHIINKFTEKARNKEKSKIEQWAKEKNIGDRCNWLNMELVFRNQQAGLRIIGKMRIGAF